VAVEAVALIKPEVPKQDPGIVTQVPEVWLELDN
jgi:hypothetical protein